MKEQEKDVKPKFDDKKKPFKQKKDFKPAQKEALKEVGKTAGDFALKVVSNPDFWAKAIPLVAKLINHDTWYGGESNAFTGAVGPYLRTVNSKQAEVMSVVTYEVRPEQLIDLGTNVRAIQDAINAYNTRLGFSSGLTTATITDYLKAAVRYLLSFAAMKRYFNSNQLLIVNGIKFGERFEHHQLFGLVEKSFIVSGASTEKRLYPDLHYRGGFMSSVSSNQYSGVNISNYNWINDWAAPVTRMMLLPQHFDLISYLGDHFFTNGMDNAKNTLFEFVNQSTVGGASISGSFITTSPGTPANPVWRTSVTPFMRVESDRDAFILAENANSYLRPFLQMMGFGAIVPNSWTMRDQTGTSILIGEDPGLIAALENAGIPDNGTSFPYVLTKSNDIDPVFDREAETLSVGALGSLLKLRYMNARPLGVSILTSVGNTVQWLSATTGDPGIDGEQSVAIFLDTPTVELSSQGVSPTATTIGNAQSALSEVFASVMSFDSIVGITRPVNYKDRIFLTFKTIVGSGLGFDLSTSAETTYDYIAGGADMIRVQDYDLIKRIVQANFTLGSAAVAKANDLIRGLVAQLSII